MLCILVVQFSGHNGNCQRKLSDFDDVAAGRCCRLAMSEAVPTVGAFISDNQGVEMLVLQQRVVNQLDPG